MTMPSDNKERELEDWWVETNGTGTDACSSCNPEFICSWHTARLDDLVALIADQCRLAEKKAYKKGQLDPVCPSCKKETVANYHKKCHAKEIADYAKAHRVKSLEDGDDN
jgi:hypothetical protein